MSTGRPLRGRFCAWCVAVLNAYLPRLAGRRPRVELEVGPWVPASVLRIIAGLLALLAGALVGPSPVITVVLVVLAAVVSVFPGSVAPPVVVVVIAALLAGSPVAPGSWPTAVIIAALHVMVQLGLLVRSSGWLTRVELGVLLLPLDRVLVIQVFVQSLALVGSWLRGYRLDLQVLPFVALLGLGALTFAWFPRLAAPPARTAGQGGSA